MICLSAGLTMIIILGRSRFRVIVTGRFQSCLALANGLTFLTKQEIKTSEDLSVGGAHDAR